MLGHSILELTGLRLHTSVSVSSLLPLSLDLVACLGFHALGSSTRSCLGMEDMEDNLISLLGGCCPPPMPWSPPPRWPCWLLRFVTLWNQKIFRIRTLKSVAKQLRQKQTKVAYLSRSNLEEGGDEFVGNDSFGNRILYQKQKINTCICSAYHHGSWLTILDPDAYSVRHVLELVLHWTR